MAINLSAVAGAAGKTFGDHLLEMRKAREARKAAFENQKELLGMQFGYNSLLEAQKGKLAIEKERIKQGETAKKGGISFNAIPGFTTEGFNYYSSAQDARARQDDYYLATLRYLSPVIDAVNNGDISPEDALQMLRNSNNETQIGLIIIYYCGTTSC